MKKTVSVNIKGMNFLIEEDAYELLQSYMNRLTQSLRNEKGNKEIIEDIEYRLAELCSTYLNEKKQVIEKEDIEQIIKTLGEPEEYVEGGDDYQTEEKNYSQDNFNNRRDKRLYRDVENAKIAGVCSGLANYFQLDVVIFRAIFLVLFFSGFGFPLYIILWVILPKAATTIDRLRMQGKPITVESVKNEVEMAAERIKEESNSFANRLRKDGYYNQRIGSIGRLITLLIGVGIVGFGLILAGFFTLGLVGVNLIPVGSDEGFLSVSDIGSIILANESDAFWMWAAILTTGFSVILFLLLLGSKLIFQLKNKWTKISLMTLFFSGIIGILLSAYIGIMAGREMTFEGEIEQHIGSTSANVLVIEPHYEKLKQFEGYDIKDEGGSGMISIEGDKIKESGIHFEYKQSKDSLFHVYRNFSAHSSTIHKARIKAKNIRHSVALEENILHVNTNYSFPKQDKLRDQEVYIIIEIPTGKFVQINNQKIRLGEDQFHEDIIDLNYTEEGELKGNGEYEDWD